MSLSSFFFLFLCLINMTILAVPLCEHVICNCSPSQTLLVFLWSAALSEV